MKYNDTNRPKRKFSRTMSTDSEDSDDDIIVKTISVPAYEAMVGDSACPGCKVQHDGIHIVAEENNKDDEDSGEVFPKVARGRMKFPCSSQCKTSHQQSTTCLNGNNGHECDTSCQKLKDSKTKRGPVDKTSSENYSDCKVNLPSAEKRKTCCVE